METTKRVMGVLVNMPPKHHEEMKIGKPKRKSKKNSPAQAYRRKKGGDTAGESKDLTSARPVLGRHHP